MFSAIMGTLLAPMVKPVQYLALKLMKSFRKKDDERPVIATADHILNDIILPSGFIIFRDAMFRELAKFKELSITEHDRIFNEIEVACICLVLFYIDAVKFLVPLSDYHFWRDVALEIPKQFYKLLTSHGVSEKNAKLMIELIDLRYEEYELLINAIWDASDQMGQEFKSSSPEIKRISACMQATAVGTTDHIRRGKIKQGDPLIKFLAQQLLQIERKISKFIRRL